jgi:hypothetical protein
MSRMRWTSVSALGVLSAVLLVSVAFASVSSVKSTVTITSGKGTEFTGKVNAAKKKCRAHRTVKLYTEASSAYVGSGSARMGDVLVDTAKTDASGAWSMDGSFIAGVYYAQVMALLVNVNGTMYRCAGDLSLRMHY